MDLAKSRMVTGNEDFITLFGEAYEEVAPNTLLSSTRIFTQNESLSQKIAPGSSNQEVLALIREEAQETIDNIYQVMSKRIDQFGVVQPNIRKAEEKEGRIFIELPGVTDANRIQYSVLVVREVVLLQHGHTNARLDGHVTCGWFKVAGKDSQES